MDAAAGTSDPGRARWVPLARLLLGRDGVPSRLRETGFTLLDLGPPAPALAEALRRRFPAARIVALPAPGGAAGLRELAACHAPLVVLDRLAVPPPRRAEVLAWLYPVLRPGGLYMLAPVPVAARPAREAAGTDATLALLHPLLRRAERTGVLPAGEAERAASHLRATAGHAALRGRLLVIRKKGMLGRRGLPTTLRLMDLAEAVPSVRDFDNGGAYRRIVPRVFDAPADIARRAQAELDRGMVQPPPAQAAWIEGATILDDGIVVTRAGRVIRESLINQPKARVFAGHRRLLDSDLVVPEAPVAVTPLGPAPHVLLKQRWDSNYGHWLVESLPRLAMAREMTALRQCRFLVRKPVSEQMRRVCLDSLALFGIAEAQVVFVGNEALFARRLLYPSPITVQPRVKAPLAIRTLEALAAEVQRGGGASELGERLYVSRNDYPGNRRVLLNEAELLPVLERRGYRLLRPETMPLRAQIAAFAGARRVVGNLGAALTNLAFSPPGVRLLALTTEFMGDDFYLDLLCHKQGSYWSLHGRATAPEQGRQSPFTVDPARFAALLDEFEAEA